MKNKPEKPVRLIPDELRKQSTDWEFIVICVCVSGAFLLGCYFSHMAAP